MSKSMTGKLLMAAIGVAALGLLVPQSADASLTIALQFDGGATTRELTAADIGTNINVNVYAVVQGTGTNLALDGFTKAFYNVKALQTTGLGAVTTGGFASPVVNATFAGFGNNPGALVDTVPTDGLVDLVGSTNTASSTGWAFVLSTTFGNVPGGGTIGSAVGTTGWAFPIEIIQLHITSLGVPGGVTTLTSTAPSKVGSANGALWNQDNVPTQATTSGAPNYFGSSVTLTVPVPEPATMAFLAIGGISMIGAGLKRRQTTKAGK